MTSIARASQALRAVAPSLNDSAHVILLGQAWAESQFGDGLRTPNRPPWNGAPSHNWGAVYMDGDLGRFPQSDTYEGKAVTNGAAWNSSPEAGAALFYGVLRRGYPLALQHASTGDLWRYAEALFRGGPRGPFPGPTGYFTGFPPGHPNGLAPASVTPGSSEDRWYRIKAYAGMVNGGARRCAGALGLSVPLHVTAPVKPGGGGALLGFALVGGVAWSAWRLWRGENLLPDALRRYLP